MKVSKLKMMVQCISATDPLENSVNVKLPCRFAVSWVFSDSSHSMWTGYCDSEGLWLSCGGHLGKNDAVYVQQWVLIPAGWTSLSSICQSLPEPEKATGIATA